NLSEDQKKQQVSIRQKYKDQISQKMQSLRTLQQELRTMMAGETSATDIRAKHTEVAKLDQELSNLRFESMLEMREVLTPEQRSQFAQIMKQRREGSRRRTNLENPQSGQEKGNRNKLNNPQLEPEKENGKNIAI
ncbi:MAG: Spy/CpxP family protein refolding chaperone, partial [Microcystaceae cyanobacterium]